METANAMNNTNNSAPKTVAIAKLPSSVDSLEVQVAELSRSQTRNINKSP